MALSRGILVLGAGLRAGIRPGDLSDRAEPPLPACKPDSAADDRLFDGVSERVAAGGDLDRRQRDRVSVRRPAAGHDREGSYTLSTETTAVLSQPGPAGEDSRCSSARAATPAGSATACCSFSKHTRPPIPSRIELDSLDPFNDVTRYEELAKRVPELELLAGRRRGDRVWHGRRPRLMRWCETRTCFCSFGSTRHQAQRPLRDGLQRRGRDHDGTDADEGRPEDQGRIHGRSRRAIDGGLESAGPRHRQLEGAVEQGGL